MTHVTLPGLLAGALAFLLAVSAPVVAHGHDDHGFSTAISGAHRSPGNKARDAYRHPVQTLQFFGVKPDKTVVEVSPSAGWYTEILAPLLHDKGVYYAAHSDAAASERAAKAVATFQAKLDANPGVYGKVKLTAFGKTKLGAIAPDGSADVVLTFRNIHNWYIGGFAPEAFATFNKALKMGGTLGIVEHQLPESMADDLQKSSGYMKRSTVVALAKAAGFKLVGSSDINANAKDTHDYPKGVWTLPPNYAEGDTDKAKYTAIGESDRMTLKFEKVK